MKKRATLTRTPLRAETIAELAPPARPGKATRLDHVRARAYARLLDKGADAVGAAWSVLSDPATGIPRWRGLTVRPKDSAVLSKIAALVRRVSPELAHETKALLVVRLEGMADHAVRAVRDVAKGRFEDPHAGRARLAAAELILRSLGVVGDRGSAPVAAVQVNVNASDAAFARELFADEETRRLATDLSRRVASRSSSDGSTSDAWTVPGSSPHRHDLTSSRTGRVRRRDTTPR
jgi:hypothetical protein